MIFLTIGTQEPFDRLVRAVDQWVATSGHPVQGQLGALKPDSYRPAHFPFSEFMDAATYDRHFEAADLVIAHAGMGSIISALTLAKPLIIMPRKASLGEHRNEHQLATAERFRGRGGIRVADDETGLLPLIEEALAAGSTGAGAEDTRLSPHASAQLLETLRAFIHG